MGNVKSSNFKGSSFTEAVYYFTSFERCSYFFFNLGEYILQIGIRNRSSGSLAYLYNEYRVYIRVMLFICVLIPSTAFFLPLLYGCFQKDDIIILGRIFGVGDNNAVFEKSRTAHLVGGDYIFLQSYVCGISDKRVESFGCCADTKNNRHRTHGVFDAVFGVGVSLNKTLHNCGIGTSFTFALCSTVRFINNEIEAICFISNGII